MKKHFLSFIVVFLFSIGISAQSLSLSWDNKILNETEEERVDPYDTVTTVFNAIVTNNSGNIMNVKVLRTNVDVIEGTDNYYSWAGQQYPSSVDESTEYLAIPAGGSSPADSFKGEFNAFENIGNSFVKYKFYDISNENDFVEVVVKYRSSPDIINEDLVKNINLKNLYPNPAQSVVNLDYAFNVRIDFASVKIVNLLGSVVRAVEMDQDANKLSIDISDLNTGIYFYSVVVNNDIFQTKKLVVR